MTLTVFNLTEHSEHGKLTCGIIAGVISDFAPIFVAVFAMALLLAVLLTPLAGRLGHRWGLVDRPGGRRKHQGDIPRTGGVSMVAAFTISVLVALLVLRRWLPPSTDPKETTRLLGLLLGSGFAFVMGLVDDKHELSWRGQILVQLGSAAIAIVTLIFIERVNNPFTDQQIVFSDLVVWALTAFWFLGAMNTVNWLDGLDGLAAGVTAILSAVLVIHMLFRAEPPQLSVAILPLALLGATLGFLPWNFSPARIFMGSNGSYFLGFAVAALGHHRRRAHGDGADGAWPADRRRRLADLAAQAARAIARRGRTRSPALPFA